MSSHEGYHTQKCIGPRRGPISNTQYWQELSITDDPQYLWFHSFCQIRSESDKTTLLWGPWPKGGSLKSINNGFSALKAPKNLGKWHVFGAEGAVFVKILVKAPLLITFWPCGCSGLKVSKKHLFLTKTRDFGKEMQFFRNFLVHYNRTAENSDLDRF